MTEYNLGTFTKPEDPRREGGKYGGDLGLRSYKRVEDKTSDLMVRSSPTRTVCLSQAMKELGDQPDLLAGLTISFSFAGFDPELPPSILLRR